jgi:hypothetical protein
MLSESIHIRHTGYYGGITNKLVELLCDNVSCSPLLFQDYFLHRQVAAILLAILPDTVLSSPGRTGGFACIEPIWPPLYCRGLEFFMV